MTLCSTTAFLILRKKSAITALRRQYERFASVCSLEGVLEQIQ